MKWLKMRLNFSDGGNMVMEWPFLVVSCWSGNNDDGEVVTCLKNGSGTTTI